MGRGEQETSSENQRNMEEKEEEGYRRVSSEGDVVKHVADLTGSVEQTCMR